MKIVIDTSALIAVILNENSKAAILEATVDASLIAPSSIQWEIGNALTSLLKRKRLTIKQALTALKSYQKISIRFFNIDLESSIKLANELNIYAYDAYLITCTEATKAPLLTLDLTMRRLAQERGLKLVEVKND
jgi:predicted nucleic acid-binding protein